MSFLFEESRDAHSGEGEPPLYGPSWYERAVPEFVEHESSTGISYSVFWTRSYLPTKLTQKEI